MFDIYFVCCISLRSVSLLKPAVNQVPLLSNELLTTKTNFLGLFCIVLYSDTRLDKQSL